MNSVSKHSFFDTVNTAILIFIALLCIFPFLYVFFLSISDGNSILHGEVTFLPKNINFEAYKYIFSNKNLNIISGLKNSAIYTIIGTVIALVSTFFTAYVLSRKQIKGRFFIMSIFIFTWVFEAGIIPTYIIFSGYGFVDNPLVMILPNAINVQYLIITKTFLEGLPYELEEAAYLDGANDWQIMSKIYLPLCVPIIATIGVFYAVFIWNLYLIPQIYFQDTSLQTIQLVLKKLVISAGDSNTAFKTINSNGYLLIPQNLKAAAIFISTVPIIFIFPFIQKYFKNGILLGSVKG
jgi:putative aldouronate transport system permease protein